MKLSYREKIILIVFVVAITLVAGFFIVIKPAIAANAQYKVDLAAKQTQKAEIDQKIADAEGLKDKIKKAYDETKDISAFFLPEMDTYQVDQYLSPYCAKNNVTITALELELAAPEEVSAYSYELYNVLYSLKDIADINAEVPKPADPTAQPAETTAATAAPVPTSPDTLAVTNVTIGISGTVEDVLKFADDIKDINKSVIITSISGKGEAGDGKAPEGEITIKIFSIKTIEEPKLY